MSTLGRFSRANVFKNKLKKQTKKGNGNHRHRYLKPIIGFYI
jgi:hypothetical protein